MPNYDAAALIQDYLKTDSDAAGVRALLLNGADSVYEVGDLTASVLSTTEEARRASGELTKALAISIHDAGERPSRIRDIDDQPVIIRVFDRQRGYRNLRSVRLVLMNVLRGHVAALDGGYGLLEVRFAGRTGYRHDLTMAVDFEAITFIGVVQRPELD